MPVPTPITVREYKQQLNCYKRDATRLFRAADDRTKAILWGMVQIDIKQVSLSGYFFAACPAGQPIAMQECGDGSCAPPGGCGWDLPFDIPIPIPTPGDYREKLTNYIGHAMILFREADLQTRALLGGLTKTHTLQIKVLGQRIN